MKNLVLLLLLFTPILANGVYPKRGMSYNVAKVSTQLKDKNYTVEVGRRFHIGLQKNESVKYVITVPVLLSNTAIGIAADENVKKLRVVIYTQLNSDSKVKLNSSLA